ncbi:MAG: flagellar basal-body rod protein FlgF [Acidobacteriota bacterium]
MIRGLYIAASGMMVQQARQDVLANNLANLNTAGFKKDRAIVEQFPEILLKRIGELDESTGEKIPMSPVSIGNLGMGSVISQVATDHSTGIPRPTENTNDLAIRSDGYFTIETPQGIRYTRDGSFKLSSEGRLVNTQGYPVMGQNGYIEPKGSFSVDEKGRVSANGEALDYLKIVHFDDLKQLKKVGDNLFQTPEGQEGQAMDNPEVLQGFLETSNVNAVQEMVDLITVTRAYEVSQKMIQAEDEVLSKTVNEVGRLT